MGTARLREERALRDRHRVSLRAALAGAARSPSARRRDATLPPWPGQFAARWRARSSRGRGALVAAAARPVRAVATSAPAASGRPLARLADVQRAALEGLAIELLDRPLGLRRGAHLDEPEAAR